MLTLNTMKPFPLSSPESIEVAWWGPNTSMSRESIVGRVLDRPPVSHILAGNDGGQPSTRHLCREEAVSW